MPILKHLSKQTILLDTHVLYWLMNDEKALSKSFKKSFETISETQKVLVSTLSIWELGMLEQKEKIEFGIDLLDWVNTSLEIPGIELCPLTPRIAVQSSRLPWEIHGDPVDRILIATAMEENAVLVTCDKKILECGKSRALSVFDPCS